MKKIKTKENGVLEFYTEEEVFKKASKSKEFQKAYYEEVMRISLARDIRKLRAEKGFTQARVAKASNMPQSVIARIESGEHSISLDTLSRIASVFGKEVRLV